METINMLTAWIKRVENLSINIIIFGEKNSSRLSVIKALVNTKDHHIVNLETEALTIPENKILVLLNLESMKESDQELLSETLRDKNLRVISSSSLELESMVSRGTFSESLFYKLAVVYQVIKSPSIKYEDLVLDIAYHPEVTLHDLEKAYIGNALKFHEGNKSQTANALGITIKTLYNKLHEYEGFKK